MKRIAARTGVFFSLAMITTLAACSTDGQERYRASQERNPAPCPNIIVLQEAGRMIEFNGEQTLENIAYSGEITGVRGTCRYFAGEPIKMEIELDMAFGRGPTADANIKNVNYFVAVTRTNRDLIAKEEFTVPVKFNRNRTIVDISETIKNITIPRANDTISGINFEIVVGLSLTQDQVIFNRSGKSLKFPTLQK